MGHDGDDGGDAASVAIAADEEEEDEGLFEDPDEKTVAFKSGL